MAKKIYDMSSLAEKIQAIEDDIGSIIKKTADHDLIPIIRSELTKTIEKDDFVKALAIIQYTLQNTDLTGNDLVLIKSNNEYKSIINMAYEDYNNADFGLELLGAGHALGFIDTH